MCVGTLSSYVILVSTVLRLWGSYVHFVLGAELLGLPVCGLVRICRFVPHAM
jgi:hypothetical protein